MLAGAYVPRGPSSAAPPSSPAAPASPAPTRAAITPQVLLGGVGPLEWNAAAERERGLPEPILRWAAVRVLAPLGTESLYVFPARADAAKLLGSWSREEAGAYTARVFPRYHWIVVETQAAPDSGEETGETKLARFYSANGALLWRDRMPASPAPLGRNLVLWPQPSPDDSIPPRVRVLRLPEGEDRSSWPGVAGWGASSPLENFLAANTVGLVDSATGLRQDELRLLDLEGKVLWVRTVAADQREFAVSNFGDVAIAREQSLRVFDRSGDEKLRVPLPRNVVGRTAITPDGRFVLVAARPPLGRRAGRDLWVGLYDVSRKTPRWTRRDLGAASDGAGARGAGARGAGASGRPGRGAVGGAGADAIELSLSEDGGRVLVRLSTGPVLLLGPDGSTLARWDLERASRGEYDPGSVPRRTWLSSDGSLVAMTMPVARTLAEARGWLYRVPR